MAELGNDGCGNRLGDDVELAMAQTVVNDEADQGLTIHNQALFDGLGLKVGFDLAGQRGVITEKTLVVVRINQDGVKRGSKFLASADHGLALHLLLCFFLYLNRRNRRLRHAIGGTLHRVFHLVLETGEKAH